MAERIMVPLLLLLCTAASGADKREITVKLTVPDAGWTIVIEEVHQVGNELWVISTVSRTPDVMSAQVISTVQDSLKLAVSDLPMKNFIIGKAWGWKNAEPYTFINDMKQIEKKVKAGQLLYSRARPTVRNTAPDSLLNKTWQWVSTITPVKKTIVPNPERYTILLTDGGKVQARFDCNRGGGSYEISPGRLALGPLLSTRMACPLGTLDADFMKDLQRVASFFMEGGDLYLELPVDSGTMRFRPAP